ncbi:hypothetical protein M569_17241, partial [Genlisea aurea]
NKKEEDEQKKKNKEGNNVTVVLKTDLHCEGCASKVIRCIRSFDGVETVEIGDGERITVLGEVDPGELRRKLEKKTHKKVELISPQLKRDVEGKEKENKDKNSGGKKETPEKKNDKKSPKEKPAKEKKIEEKKSKEKELPVTTAALKVNLHCDGCIQKIHKTVIKTKGYQDMNIDKQKNLVTVTGAMDMKALAELLQKQLRKDVEIVPASSKKEAEEKKGGGDRNEEKSEEGNRGRNPAELPSAFGFAIADQFNYSPNPYAAQYHAPQIFSDENPNSCAVM